MSSSSISSVSSSSVYSFATMAVTSSSVATTSAPATATSTVTAAVSNVVNNAMSKAVQRFQELASNPAQLRETLRVALSSQFGAALSQEVTSLGFSESPTIPNQEALSGFLRTLKTIQQAAYTHLIFDSSIPEAQKAQLTNALGMARQFLEKAGYDLQQNNSYIHAALPVDQIVPLLQRLGTDMSHICTAIQQALPAITSSVQDIETAVTQCPISGRDVLGAFVQVWNREIPHTDSSSSSSSVASLASSATSSTSSASEDTTAASAPKKRKFEKDDKKEDEYATVHNVETGKGEKKHLKRRKK